MDNKEALAKRKLAFSENARRQILHDQLRDSSLLSRSASTNIALRQLQRDQCARDDFLKEIETQEEQAPNSSLVEHGLRKLREIIVAAGSNICRDPKFLDFATRVYEKTVKYYCKHREAHKSYPSIRFYVDNLLQHAISNSLSQQMVACCALYISHGEGNLTRCLTLLNSHMLNSDLYEPSKTLSLVYCIQNQPPSVWFKVVSELPDSSLIRIFISALPAFQKMQQRTMKMISVCYNQLSVSFLSVYWFHGMWKDLEHYVSQNWTIETLQNSTKIVKFKAVGSKKPSTS
ncbi:LANO_0F07756g1_1 [Lachancea nothofagi CBS 11611]|uniref:LANO_0F07756g1_1 n=1 Tax=Lachancea nothofagi CBS 11611 TaxID=1266666 RepID=A0A1G4K9B2_9SACH|nr:LANO_0F07756g1_1 [Lachancea nothofagi CBS 11611]